jgi:zinc protease
MPAIDWSHAQLPSVVERLANGLTVIVHSEPKAPIAAMYLAYQAGSRDEPKFKAGLAHLCEHLMFSGTRNNPGSYFARFEQAGATSMNAYVREDYSAYFATVPVSALEFAMSMEADRMANLAEALSDGRVERQRDVVVSELRQRDAQPYGCVARILAELAHPLGHPYAHLPDGLITEVGNLSTNDAREWIRLRHSPTMATLIVAGAVEPGRVMKEAKSHFGMLASGPEHPLPAFEAFHIPSELSVAPRLQIELPVKNARLCMAWTGPSLASAEYPAAEATCEILAGVKRSRLAQRIIRAERLASDLTLEVRPRALGMMVVLSVSARIGVPLRAIETVVRDEIERLYAEGPSLQELDAARLRLFGKIVRSFERVGGPQGRSDALGLAVMVGGTIDSHQRRVSMLAATNPDEVAAACRWLVGGGAVLEMLPAIGSNG